MQHLYLALALFLLLNLGAGMWRVLRGPTAADRMLAEVAGSAALRDVAPGFFRPNPRRIG